MASPITGIDHVVVLVAELEAAAERYRKLGFTLTPRGTHSAHMGTGNYCIMFRTDYVELLGILQATEHNQAWRGRLAQGEGLKSVALSADAAAAHAHFTAVGLEALPPLEFGRPVEMPEGVREAKFRIVRVADSATPAFTVFVCQHFTRELVWLPAYQRHANTVTGIAGVVVVSPNPSAMAAPYARIFGVEPRMDAYGQVTVAAGAGRSFRFITPSQAKVAYAGATAPQGETYVAALELQVEATGRAAAAISRNGVPHTRGADGRVRVRAEQACGAVLDFVAPG